MKTKKKLTIFASLVVAGGLLAGCSSTEETDASKEETPSTEIANEETEAPKAENTTEQAEQSLEESVVAKQVTAYQNMMTELGKMKEDQPVDWELVQSEYKNNLQTAITEVSGEFDQAITAAIEAGKAEQLEPNVARQLIDKTTQSYFYQKQKSLHKDVAAALEAEKQAEAEFAFAQLKLLAEKILIPTAEKRDNYYELSGEASIVENINSGLAAQEAAVKEGNADDYSVYAQVTDKSTYRSYYLAAQSYGEKIEKAVADGAELTELQIMQAEGWGFYQAIKGSLSGGDEEAATKLDEIFSIDQTEPANIKSDEVSSLFTKAFVGKIKGYHEKAPKAIEEGDLTKARTQALEGNVFLKDIEIELKKKLGDDKAKETLDHAQQWFDAISAENLEEAATHSEAVVAVLDELVK